MHIDGKRRVEMLAGGRVLATIGTHLRQSLQGEDLPWR
jgi:hypothetical protein